MCLLYEVDSFFWSENDFNLLIIRINESIDFFMYLCLSREFPLLKVFVRYSCY